MGPAEVREHCLVGEAGASLLRAATPALRAGVPVLVTGPGSARAYHRIFKLVRTIADLAGSDSIETAHPSASLRTGLAEAIQYRPRRQA